MIITPENVVADFTLETPLDWGLSKNRKTTQSKGRTIYNANKDKVDALMSEIFYLSKDINWRMKHKVWVFITAHKRDNRGDVANFVDSVADAVKESIGVDDCWFSFILDQVIDKKEIITIRILQEG
jgi:hypothetical protein